MADAGTSAGRILPFLNICRLIQAISRLGVLRSQGTVRTMLAFLGNNSITTAAHRLHGDRNSQRIAAE